MSKIQYTRALGKLLTTSIQNSKESVRYHVVSGLTQNWSVISEGSTKAVKSFSEQEEAINYAKQKVANRTGEIVIHTKNGQIGSRIPVGI